MRVPPQFGQVRDVRVRYGSRVMLVKGDAVARFRQCFEMERRRWNFESGVKVPGQLRFWVARNFHGGELPHAGEEHVVVRARIANEKRSCPCGSRNTGWRRCRFSQELAFLRTAGISAVRLFARAWHQRDTGQSPQRGDCGVHITFSPSSIRA